MENQEAKILGVIPSPYGYALFLECAEKTFVIYMDKCCGSALERSIKNEKSDRPYTHELMAFMLDGLDCVVKDVLIYHTHDGTFYAKLTLQMQNELGSKILRLDCRPSDSISLAARTKAPIFVSKKVLDSVEDVSKVWDKFKDQL